MIYVVQCDKCGRKVNTSFGIVGTTQIAEPIINCECGGKFQAVNEAVKSKGVNGGVSTCSNSKHPNGMWHEATPIPGSWEWLKTIKYNLRMRKYGCGCEVKKFKTSCWF